MDRLVAAGRLRSALSSPCAHAPAVGAGRGQARPRQGQADSRRRSAPHATAPTATAPSRRIRTSPGRARSISAANSRTSRRASASTRSCSASRSGCRRRHGRARRLLLAAEAQEPRGAGIRSSSPSRAEDVPRRRRAARRARRARHATRPRARASRRTSARSSGQYADYTYAQLKAFKSGERGNEPAARTPTAASWHRSRKKLTDAQMKALRTTRPACGSTAPAASAVRTPRHDRLAATSIRSRVAAASTCDAADVAVTGLASRGVRRPRMDGRRRRGPLPHAARAPRLALVAVDAGGGRACAAAPHCAARVCVRRAARSRDVVVWRSTVRGSDAGDAAAGWLSDWLGARRAPGALRSRAPRECNRNTRATRARTRCSRTAIRCSSSIAASLADLNERLARAAMRRCR